MEQASVNARAGPPANGARGVVFRARGLAVATAKDTRLGPFDLEVRAGEVVSLLGTASVGLCTLVRTVVGLLPPAAGDALLRESPVTPGHPSIGVSFADPLLFEWRSVIGNVMLQATLRRLPQASARSRARQLLEDSGLHQAEDRRPADLSQAEARRVSICRALLHEPEFLVLEEPFDGLDAVEREQLVYDIERVTRSTAPAILMTTSQAVEGTMLADRLALVAGTPPQILQWFEVRLARPRRWDKEQTPRLAEVTAAIRTLLHSRGVLA